MAGRCCHRPAGAALGHCAACDWRRRPPRRRRKRAARSRRRGVVALLQPSRMARTYRRRRAHRYLRMGDVWAGACVGVEWNDGRDAACLFHCADVHRTRRLGLDQSQAGRRASTAGDGGGHCSGVCGDDARANRRHQERRSATALAMDTIGRRAAARARQRRSQGDASCRGDEDHRGNRDRSCSRGRPRGHRACPVEDNRAGDRSRSHRANGRATGARCMARLPWT